MSPPSLEVAPALRGSLSTWMEKSVAATARRPITSTSPVDAPSFWALRPSRQRRRMTILGHGGWLATLTSGVVLPASGHLHARRRAKHSQMRRLWQRLRARSVRCQLLLGGASSSTCCRAISQPKARRVRPDVGCTHISEVWRCGLRCFECVVSVFIFRPNPPFLPQVFHTL